MLLQLNDNRHSVDIMFTITNIYYGYFDRSDLVPHFNHSDDG